MYIHVYAYTYMYIYTCAHKMKNIIKTNQPTGNTAQLVFRIMVLLGDTVPRNGHKGTYRADNI